MNMPVIFRTLIAFILLTTLSSSLMAHKDGDIVVHDAWIPEAPPNVKVLAAYFEIQNHTAKDVTLTSITSSQFKRIEIHETQQKEGMAKMVKLNSLLIPAEGKINFKAGSYHLMLRIPKKGLHAGDRVGLALHFDNGKKVLTSAKVKKRKKADSGHHHQHEH